MNKFFITTLLVTSFNLFAAEKAQEIIEDTTTVELEKKKPEVTYKTQFGKCPSHSAGQLALKLVKTFEETKSLYDVRKQITNENLEEKYFLANYQIKYNPIYKELMFKLNCPEPLMKVQVYKEDSSDTYEAILGDNAELYDPTYEVLLREEKILKSVLPSLAIPVTKLDKKSRGEIAGLIKKLHLDLKYKLSEMILNEKSEMTLILSVKNHPSSVFLGKEEWPEKVKKLSKIIGYMEAKDRIPAVINLTNSKKVVVKFNDKF